MPAPTRINVPQRAQGTACPNGAAHSWTELRHVHLTTKSYGAMPCIRCRPNDSANQLQALYKPRFTQINASLFRPHGGRARAEAEAPAACRLHWLVGPLPILAAEIHSWFRGTLLPARPHSAELAASSGARPVTRLLSREADRPDAMSEIGQRRARAQTNQRSLACGRNLVPKQSPAPLDRIPPRPFYNHIITKPRIAFAVGPTHMQISCSHYSAEAHAK